MVNAGAIMTASLIKPDLPNSERLAYVSGRVVTLFAWKEFNADAEALR